MMKLEANQSKEENMYLLESLNDQLALIKLGGMIFIGLLMLVGVFGNGHVIFLYGFKFKRSNHRIYILFLAVIDMVTCCIGMPFVIIDLRFPLMFRVVIVCKILRFLNYFMSCSSALILLVIAVDRYKKICVPFGSQMSEKRALLACVISLCIALSLSWPAPVLYGYSTVSNETISGYFDKKINISGVQCFTEDRFAKTKFQAYYNIVLVAVVIIGTAILSVLYTLIGRRIHAQAKKFKSCETNKIKNDDVTYDEFDSAESRKTTSSVLSMKNIKSEIPNISSNNPKTEIINNSKLDISEETENKNGDRACPQMSSVNENPSDGDINRTDCVSNSKDSDNRRQKQSQRITLILFTITAVFVLSFIPHLSLKTVAFLRKDYLVDLPHSQLVAYNLFVWSFFINNIANPIIYGFCEPNFRKEFKKLYRCL